MQQTNSATSKSAANGAFSYDYITVETNDKFALEYVDCYEALGFELVKNERSIEIKTASLTTVLTFKRDRKIQNKDQLKKIQAKIDETLAAMSSYEQNKSKLPFIAAISIGTGGALAFGGGMCLCLLVGGVGGIVGGIALGAVGLGIAYIAYLTHKKLFAKKSAEMNILIDKMRDELGTLCEEAQKYIK